MTENVQSSNTGSKVTRTAKPPVPTSAPVETSPASSKTATPQHHEQRPQTDQRPQTEADKVAAVAELFTGRKERGAGGDERDPAPDTTLTGESRPRPADEAPDASLSGGAEADPDANAGSADPGKPTLAALAETLGVEAKDLYAIEIPLGDNETITLGKLKDAHKSIQQFERDFSTRRADLDRRELSLVQEQHLMNNVLAALDGQITPQMAQYIDNYDRRVDAEERRALMQHVPALADKMSRQQFTDRAVNRFAEITGRSKQEAAARLGMLRGRGSALDVKFLHAAIEAFEELDRLKGFKRDAERQAPAPNRRSGGPKGQQDKLTAARKLAAGGTDADKAAAITALLRG